MALTDRELATVLIIGAAVVGCAFVPRANRFSRPLVANLWKALAAPKLLGLFLLFILWCAGWVALAWRLNVWEFSELYDTALIVLTIGFPLLFRAANVEAGPEIGSAIRTVTFGGAVFFAFYLNLESFPLPVEIVGQLVLVVVSAMFAFSSRNKRYTKVAGCMGVLLGIALAVVVVWTTVQTIVHAIEGYDVPALVRQVAVSIWLPVLMFPFLYGFAFVTKAENIVHRTELLGGATQRTRVRVAVILGLHFSVKWAARFDGRYKGVARSQGFREALAAMREFREDVERRDGLQAALDANLIAFAGVKGADGTGAQHDRREFYATKDRLRMLAVFQRAQRDDGTFPAELSAWAVDAEKHGLPAEHGFKLETTPGSQKWRVWRRLPSGWVLAIGGTDENDEFYFSAAEPPTTWPPDPDEWTSNLTPELPPDWARSDYGYQ